VSLGFGLGVAALGMTVTDTKKQEKRRVLLIRGTGRKKERWKGARVFRTTSYGNLKWPARAGLAPAQHGAAPHR
jgi:transketolase N-terminal domain/subunit